MDQYVYVHVDPDTEDVVYIGVGKNSRAYASHNVRSPEHLAWMNSLHNEGVNFVEFIAIGLSSGEALNMEREMIQDLCPRFNKGLNPEYKKQREKEKYGEEVINSIKFFRSKGYSYKQVGELVNLGTMTVGRLDKNHD